MRKTMAKAPGLGQHGDRGGKMSDSGGWIARMARRFGDILGGGAASSVDLGTSPEVRDDFWAEEPERHRASDAAPASPAASNQTSGGSGIRRDGNGRYVVAGWTFSTLDQALEFEADRAPAVRTPTSQPPASPAPAVPSTPVASFPTSQSVTPASSGRAAPRWIGSPEALSAGGVGFETEMVYFGTPLRHEPRHDHSRIDPTLKVDTRGDPAGTTLGYWPSYREFDPRARATYLGWLTDGRRAVSVPSGYLFVFFYGLEQRLLVDDARADAPAIFSELRRLMALHHQDYSFQGHASRLLALAALYEDEDDDPPTAECARNWDVELPLDVRIRLGRRLRDGVPFNADDALRWVLALPDVHLRTPGQRCFAELRDLWSARFAVRHPDGLTVRRPKRTLRHEYRAASGKFSVNLSVDELPDVSGISAPLGQLRAMLDLCIDDLSAYSRLVGRDPDARGRLHAELLLPVELRDRNPALASCRERLEKLVSGGTRGVIAAIELARLLDLDVDKAADKLPTAVVRQIGMALDALQHGLEPDRRYGPAPTPRADTPMAVFPAHGGGAVEHERQAYADARTAMEVAVLAAASDGEVVAAELEAVERRLRSTPNLAEHEIARLVASGRALAADPPKVRAAMKRLADAPATARASIATAAVEAVLADGMVQPGEVKFLETLHATLNLPASALYAALHRGAEDVGPILVEPGRPEELISIPSEPVSSSVAIDAARLARIQGETSRVSALLATIFVEEEQEASASAVAAPRPTPRATNGFDGLDGLHSELLTRLLSGPLDRDAFDGAAAALRLMPEGAIETINEWGFDRFGEPVLDDDDIVRISPEIMDQIMPMGAAA